MSAVPHIIHLVPGISSRRVREDATAREYVDDRVSLLDKVLPERLKYRDVNRAVKTLINSLGSAQDPMDHYLNDTPDSKDGPWRNQIAYIIYSYHTINSVHKRSQWTINRGDSLMCCWPPPKGAKPMPIETYIDSLFQRLEGSTWSKQQSERQEEFRLKVRQAVTDSIRYRIQDMFYVSGVATTPAKQGRGYASALMRLAGDMADEQGCATWLVVGNIATNHGFYELFGYKTVKRFYIGDSNPDWTEPSVPIDVMVRESQSSAQVMATPV